MFQFLRQLWHRLCARLRFCGGVQYLAGTASLPSPLSPAEEKALLARMAAGEADARDALILHNLRLVVYLAKKYENSGVPAEDLISIGTIGLIKAVNSFDNTKGARFATYAARCIENEVLMQFRAGKKSQNDVSIQEPIDSDKDGNSLTLNDVVADTFDVHEDYERKEETEALYRVVNRLSGRERQIVIMRYGLSGTQPLTQQQVADILHISRSYVSRIEKKALEELRAMMRKGASAGKG